MKSKVILFSVLLFCSKFVDSIDRQRAYQPSNWPDSQGIPNRQYRDTDFAQTRDGKTNSAFQQENSQDYYANQGRYNYDSYGYNKSPVSSHSGKKPLVNFDSTADRRRLDSYPSRVESNPSRTFQAGLDNQQYRTQNLRSQNQYASASAAVIQDNERPLVTSVQEPYRGPDQYLQLKFVPSSNRRYHQTDKILPTREQYQYPSAGNSGDTKYIANSASRSGLSGSVPKENYSEDEVIASETRARPNGGHRQVESFAPQSNNVKHVENYRSHSDLRNTAPITNYNDGSSIISTADNYNSDSRPSNVTPENDKKEAPVVFNNILSKQPQIHRPANNYRSDSGWSNIPRGDSYNGESDSRPGDSAPINTNFEPPPAPERYPSQHKPSNRASEDTYLGQDLYQQLISGIKTYNLKSIVSNQKIKDLLVPPNKKHYRYVVVHPNGTVQYLNELDIDTNNNSKYQLVHRKRLTFDEAGDDTEGIYPTQSPAYTRNNIAPAPIPDTLPLNVNQPIADNNPNPLPPYYDNNQPDDDNNPKPLPPYENKRADYNNLTPLPQNVNQPETKPVDDDNYKPLPSFVSQSENDNKPEILSPYETQQVDDTKSKPLPPYEDQPEDNDNSNPLPPYYENQPADDNNPKPLPPYENKPADDDNSKPLPSFVNHPVDYNKPLLPYEIQQVDDTQPKPLPPYVDQPEDDNKSTSLPPYENKPTDDSKLKLTTTTNNLDEAPYVDQPEDDNKSKSLPPYGNKPTDDSKSKLTTTTNNLDDDQFTSTTSSVTVSDYNTSSTPQVLNEPQDKEEDQLSTTNSPAVVTTPNPDNTSTDEIITISPIELTTDNVSDVPPVTTTTTSPTETTGELDSIKHVSNKKNNTSEDTTSSSTDLDKTYSTTTVVPSSSASAIDNINEDKIIKETVKNKNYNQTEDETAEQINIGNNDTQTNTDVPAKSDDYSSVTTSHLVTTDVNTGETSTPGHDSLEVEKSETDIIITVTNNTSANDSEDGTITISIEVSNSTDDGDDEDSSSDEKKILVSIDPKNSCEDDSQTSKTDDCKKVQTNDDGNKDMTNTTEEPTMWIRTTEQGFIDQLMAKNETESDLLYLFFIENQPIIEREKETTIFCNGTVVIEMKETKYACEDDSTPIITKTRKIMQIEDYESEKSNLGSKN